MVGTALLEKVDGHLRPSVIDNVEHNKLSVVSIERNEEINVHTIVSFGELGFGLDFVKKLQVTRSHIHFFCCSPRPPCQFFGGGQPHIEVKSALTFVSIILRHCTVFDLVPGPTIFDVIMSTNGGNRGSRETNQSSYRPMQLPGFERRRIGAGLVAYDRIDRIQPLPTESDIETSSEHHYKLLSDFSYFGTLAIVLSSLWDGLIHATNLQTVFIEVQVVLGLLFMLEIWAGHYCFLINERFNGIVFTSQGTINLCITILAASFNAKGLEQHETGKPLGLLYSLLLYLQLDASIEALKRPNLANRKSSVAFFALWCVRAGLGVASSFLNKAFKGIAALGAFTLCRN
ncbi:hypothetical protein CPB84DRAFT_1742851 [Gymnopilus junonius]|uniref:Uncharacterized protein n=1 Tax=Gymnopilus junonius TaxID=109634 RepID=A0A9P5TTR9_GYMJU|nr:hypothetical protein CPB84DRAFT_1742851 [Gymnopilus junonius]